MLPLLLFSSLFDLIRLQVHIFADRPSGEEDLSELSYIQFDNIIFNRSQ